MSVESRLQDEFWSGTRGLILRKIRRGDFRVFDFPSYPKFNYFIIRDRYLEHRFGTAIPISGGNYSWGHPERHYIVVKANMSPNHAALTALHEYYELFEGSHSAGTREERRFAKKFGFEKEFFEDKFAQARKMAKGWAIQNRDIYGKPLYPER